jgi:AbrB family looped-hinge helix DNA binding protein
MPRQTGVLRLSSKGQLVIPAALRRKVGLKTGQVLAVRAGRGDEIVLRPAGAEPTDLESMLRRARAWRVASRRDLVEELHARRRRERERDTAER